MSRRLFLFLCFLPFRNFNDDIKSEQGRKLKTAAFAFSLSLGFVALGFEVCWISVPAC